MSQSVVTVFSAVLARDLKLFLRHKSELFQTCLFFCMSLAIFPLGLSPDAALLRQIAPGLIVVLFVIAIMLGLDRLFVEDYHDGSLALFQSMQLPLGLIVAAKIVAHWLSHSLPLLILLPLFALMLQLPLFETMMLVTVLLITAPSLCLLGAIVSALTTGLRQSTVLLSLLLFPLIIPLLIFSTATVENVAQGLAVGGQIAILLAILIACLMLAPPAAAFALKVRLGD